jgi:hypothetical protein
MADNEFRISEVPPGSTLLVGGVAVFNADGTFCAISVNARTDKATERRRIAVIGNV